MAEATQQAVSTLATGATTEFSKLLEKEFRPKTSGARAAVESAVRTLAEQALRDTTVMSDDVLGTIKALMAEIDSKLTNQLNLILHDDKFQALEGAWRGLSYLVNNTETDEQLKIRVMSVSKKDLAKTLNRFDGTGWDQSPIFKKLYEQEYGMFGGEPYGCLVGDYQFDHSPTDVKLLGQMAQIAAAAHAPFIAGANSTLMGMDTWQELANPRDLSKIFSTSAYAGWRSLRESDDAKYIGLAMPRFLSRLPYGAKSNPVEDFDFEEETSGGDHNKYTWANAAYAMAVNINRSFKDYGWCSSIRGVESGGLVEGLPVHTFPNDDGGVDMKCPTEIGISNRRENELASCGLMPLSHRKNTDQAAFVGAQSLQLPQEYDDPEATSNAKLAARLPYLFASCRFAHYLNKMVYDKVGSGMERAELEAYLSKWIQQYVVSDPSIVGLETRAKRPLQSAKVKVTEIEGNPGFYAASFFLRPHYQLEGVKVTLSLVSRVPTTGK